MKKATSAQTGSHTDARQYLGCTVTVTIDRPLGSRHPRHGHYYPVNYGFVSGTLSPDDGELDAYVLGVFEPVESLTGRCIAIIHRTNDDDDKLIVVPEDRRYTRCQIRALTEFQERFCTSTLITHPQRRAQDTEEKRLTDDTIAESPAAHAVRSGGRTL